MKKARSKKGEWNPFGGNLKDLSADERPAQRRRRKEGVKEARSEIKRQLAIGKAKRKTELYRTQAELYEAKNRKRRAAQGGRGGEPISRKLKRGFRVSRRKPRWF